MKCLTSWSWRYSSNALFLFFCLQDAVGVLIESFEMFGPHFEVLVAAYSRVGVSSENTIKALQIGRVSSESWIRTKLVFIILTPVLMIGLLKISISLISIPIERCRWR